VFAGSANNDRISKPSVGVSTVLKPSLFYHRDAFAFASADLTMPDGVDWAARQVMDGISIRIVRAYDINNDVFPTRIDILYGDTVYYDELACRLGGA
jgi:hypothetical protein